MVEMSFDQLVEYLQDNVTELPANITTPAIEPKIPVHYGYIAVFVSVIFFGSNFLPVKKFKTGNGVFFQWILCVGIWIVGLVVNAIRNFPPFHPLVMIGGFVWCTGNMMVVPIINFVGLAKGILIWGSFNLLMGWASSRFGWFGMHAQNPSSPIMNFIGVGLCLTSACIYLFMKTSGNTEDKPIDDQDIDEKVPSLDDNVDVEMLSKKSRRRELLKKIGGSLMAVFAGCLFGLTFVPVVYKKDRDSEASSNGLDYVFAHFTGIFITSTTYFMIYCATQKNNPVIYPKVILPGFVSGLMWGIACVAWFVANDALSESISFPIITTLPGIIGTLWGLMFGEIKGWKNYLVLVIAISIGISGSITTGFSK